MQFQSAVRLTEPPVYILANVPAAASHSGRIPSPDANDLPTYEEAVDGKHLTHSNRLLLNNYFHGKYVCDFFICSMCFNLFAMDIV